MKKENCIIGTKVLYNDMREEFKGEIVGIGSLGITVEFDDSFDGHSGDRFLEENGVAKNENSHHWHFDFEEDIRYEKTYLIEELEEIKERGKRKEAGFLEESI